MSYGKPYMESSVFIEYVKDEDKEKCEKIDSCIVAAKNDAFKITTATWTIAEVHKRRGYSKGVPLTEKQSQDILPYFREPFIEAVEIDRAIAERAHELCREYPDNGKDKTLKPGDAIHIAAAERAGCDVIWTYDPDFLKLQYTKIKIEEPPFMKGVELSTAVTVKMDFGEPQKS